MRFRLAILCTHPIQYYAPVFQLLALEKNIDLKVFYSLGRPNDFKDKGFDKKIEWDIPLLQGYEYTFLNNSAKYVGSHCFTGVKNPEIISVLETYNADAILVYGWSYHSHLKVMRHFYRKTKIWFRGDSTILKPKPFWKTILRKQFLKLIYRNVDVAFYVGERNLQYYLANGLKDKQLVFSPHAIDNDRFSQLGENDFSIRRLFNISETDVAVLYAGKLEDIKNPFLLLNAFIKLNRINAHLIFVGNGKLEEKLKQGRSDAINPENIHFLDFQNQSKMPSIYQDCDLFCLPSHSETWGLSVNEAMAAGCPVIVSDKVGCAIDLIEESSSGWIFRSNDEHDLLIKLKQAVSDRKTLTKMGVYAKEKIENWSFITQINAIKKVISETNGIK